MTKNLNLFNTLSRKKEKFVPIDYNKIGMYVCGPTVYDFPHIGNARPLVVFDVLFRILKKIYGKNKVTYVRNITDIDDKIIESSKKNKNFKLVALTENRLVNKKFNGIKRKLPPLLAGNPVNYSKLNKLTTAEALSGSLYILGFKDQSLELLNKFKWGHTFYELNQNLLNDYSQSTTEEEIKTIVTDYGLI